MPLTTCPKCGEQYYGVGCPKCDYPPTVPDVSETKRRRIIGILMLAVGAFISTGFFVGPAGPDPGWVLLVAAGIFLLVGIQLVTGAKGRVSSLMGGLAFIGFSVLGFYVAFGPGPIAGGVPFFPAAWNQKLGKILFGVGACFTAMAAFYFFRQAWKPNRSRG